MSKNIKLSFKSEWFVIVLILLSFIAAPQFYQLFPKQVPSHWNLSGKIDSYTSPAMAAFLLPSLMFFIYLIFLLIPRLDPKREQYVKFQKTYYAFKDLIISFLFILYFLVSLNGIGHNINISFWVPILVGALLIIVGFLLKNIQANWFIGIRTPWTLSSDFVWKKTHQLSNWILVILGLLLISSVFIPILFKKIILLASLLILLFSLPIYSYFLYQKEKRRK